jgi:PBSX family phage terminase large subunit
MSDEKEIRFKPHSQKQDEAIFSDASKTLVATGIQFGKTKIGCVWMKRKMHEFTAPDDNFIIAAPNYKIMQQATLPDFLRYMDGFGTYNKTDAVFKMHHGGQCYMRTGTDPDSVVGITNVRAIYGDEVGKYSLYFWENIQARSSFRQCPIMLTTSPYTLNWVYKELIRPTIRGERTDVKLIQAASNENPYFPPDEYLRKKKTMDKRRFDMIYGGEWNLAAGVVYDCFSHDESLCAAPVFPIGTKYYAGIDWGFTDPFVILIMAITPQGGRFVVSEFYKTGLTIKDQVEIAVQKQKIYGCEKWFCDPSRPDAIEMMQRSGVTAQGSINDIRMGIDLTYELLKERKLKFIRGATPYLIDEIETYHYPEEPDLRPDQDGKELMPVGQNDHTMDCLRYLVVMTHDRKITDRQLPKRKPIANKKHVENWG